jgi:hypothetical protein
MIDLDKYQKQKERVEEIFRKTKSIHCPYFENEVIFNADGWHHLRYSDRHERNKEEQLLKFNLLPLAIKVIKKSGTLQEYRTGLIQVSRRSPRDGLALMKKVEYWGFLAICGGNNEGKKIKIRAILRRIGDGNIIFWSVMSFGDISNQRLFIAGIEDE